MLPLVTPFAKLTHSLPGSGNLLLTLGYDPTIPGAFASENIILQLSDSGLPTARSHFVESRARSFIPTCEGCRAEWSRGIQSRAQKVAGTTILVPLWKPSVTYSLNLLLV